MTALTWHVRPTDLHRPVLVVALSGWFDAADAATEAVRRLGAGASGEAAATIDPEPFFDFTVERPEVSLDEAGDRVLSWPANDVVLRRGERDLMILAGHEPNFRWRTFAGLLVDVARESGTEMVVTAGATAEAIPHTRVPDVVSSSTDRALASRLGLAPPRYEGPTGVVGVLHVALEGAGIPAISLRAGVPHYLLGTVHPQATIALVRHLDRILGLATPTGELEVEADEWRSRHDAAVATDPDALAYVGGLERDFDRRVESSLPSGDELAAELERYLRERRGEAP